ncbi:MAG: hypothetical protein RL624_819 [Bacteroidota bacterium]|jgi:hypothetical protein
MKRTSLTFFIVLYSFAYALADKGVNDTIRCGTYPMPNGDTLPSFFLADVIIRVDAPAFIKQQREANLQKDRELALLRYNVYKAYPYALIAANVIKNVDEELAKLPNRKAEKIYLKKVEAELKSKFKGQLENLTMSQGAILVKLINRETGKDCYGIIKDLKGGFSAIVWQSVAFVFNNNLRKRYDPIDEDREIEKVVQEINQRGYYRQYRAHK